MATTQFSETLCHCGCGTTVISTDRRPSRRRRFIKGHNSKLLSAELAKRPPKPAPQRIQACECGCGELLTSEPRFLKGHNARLGKAEPGNRGSVQQPNDPRGPNPSGRCMCGCLRPVPISADNHKGRVTGCYVRYLRGHDKITTKRIGGTGLCFCGCGKQTPIAKQSKLGNIAGQPQMYCFGHRQRSPYRIDEQTGCWILPVHRKDGYSRIHRNGELYMGHRWFWEQRYGPIPYQMTLDHLCRVRACANPDHMELCSLNENSRRVTNHPEIPKWGDWNERDITVDQKTGCWRFPITQDDGYARFWMGTRLISAHRFYYERVNGIIPAGMELDHICRTRNCVRPDHLEPVTRTENGRRARAFQALANPLTTGQTRRQNY